VQLLGNSPAECLLTLSIVIGDDARQLGWLQTRPPNDLQPNALFWVVGEERDHLVASLRLLMGIWLGYETHGLSEP